MSEDTQQKEAKVSDANDLIGKQRTNLLIEKHGKDTLIAGINEYKKNQTIQSN